VLLPGFVVQEGPALDRLLDPGGINPLLALPARGRGHTELEKIQGRPRIAVGVQGNRANRIVVDGHTRRTQAAFRVREGPPHDRADLVGGQATENEDLGSREERRVDLE
jgi:hypothetical protein